MLFNHWVHKLQKCKMQNAKPKMQKLSCIHHPSTQSSTLHTCLTPLRQKTGRQVKVNRGHNPTQTPNSTYTLFIVVHILISRRNTTQKLCATCLIPSGHQYENQVFLLDAPGHQRWNVGAKTKSYLAMIIIRNSKNIWPYRVEEAVKLVSLSRVWFKTGWIPRLILLLEIKNLWPPAASCQGGVIVRR